MSGSLIAQLNPLSLEVEIPAQTASLGELLQQLSEKSQVRLTYSPDQLPLDRRLYLGTTRQSIAAHLKQWFQGERVQFKVKRKGILITPLEAPAEFILYGYVREVGSGEALISAAVVAPDCQRGRYTNEYGYFSLRLPQGANRVRISYVGFQDKWLDLEVKQDQFVQISLNSAFSLEAVEIESTEDELALPSLSQHDLTAEQLESLPNLLGQQDMIKNIQLLPGVQSMTEGINGLAVRGGNPDQNLILLDEVPIYNPSHSLGFFSVFYGDAVQKTRLMKGDFPASVGGRLSSVVDVRMKEGNLEKFQGEFSTGLLLGTLRLEGPIRKGKTSFHLAARRTVLDLFTSGIQLTLQNQTNFPFFVNYNFDDFNFKLNHRFSSNSRLYFSTYWGNDRFLNEQYDAQLVQGRPSTPSLLTRLRWGNRVHALRWTQVLGRRWFVQAVAHRSQYQYQYNDLRLAPDLGGDSLKVVQFGNVTRSRLQDWGIKVTADYYPSPQHEVQLGVGALQHRFAPFVSSFQVTDTVFLRVPPSIPKSNLQVGHEWFAYAQDRWKLTHSLTLNAGLRVNGFYLEKASYHRWEPRLSLHYRLRNAHVFSASVNRMVQFVHLLTTQGVGLPSDLWVPSTGNIRPQTAWHYNLGYAYRSARGWRFRFEAYLKQLRNLLEYEQLLSFQGLDTNQSWEEIVTVGKGWSYGGEWQVERTQGKWTGWLAYTLSWSYRQFDAINEGKPFPFRLDRRHDLSINVLYKPSERREFGAVWMYGSGQPTILGVERFFSNDPATFIILPGPRNNYRMPDYHRLDVSVSFHKPKKNRIRTWVFGVYNLYNHQNPLAVFFQTNGSGGFQLVQQSLLPILPYATYRVRF
ncbi:MAG: TonB-dependent receptor [Bacteroidota bacterium]